MKFIDFFNILYDGYGAGEAKHKFLYTFMKEIVTNLELLNYNENTYRSYANGNRNPKKFLQNIIDCITDKNLMSYFDEISNDRKTANRLIKILHEKGFDCELDDLSIVLFDMFNAMIEQTIYGAIKGNAEVKKIINRLKTLWDELFRIGWEISENASYTEKMFYSGKIRGLKIQLNTFHSEFKNENINLLTFRNKFKEIEKLYLVSLEIKSEFFENRFNIPELLNEYDEILKRLIKIIEFTEEGNY